MSNEKVALIILDGYGIGEPNAGNAIYMAKTPVMDSLLQRWPHTKLSASGLDVGLPDGQMGNSEVGHTNIGSGRVVFQDLPRITNAISDGSFFENPVYGAALDNAANGKALHILGLRRRAARAMSASCMTIVPSSARARSQRCRDASTAWTVTSAGTASRRATMPWSAVRVCRTPTPSTRWRRAMPPV